METLVQFFKEKYNNDDIRAVRSPLRICPIGAHSDYQGGRVTGMTLDASVDMIYSPTEDGYVRLQSLDLPDKEYFHINHDSEYIPGFWGNYIRGAVFEYCIQIEPPVRKSEPLVAGNRASYCGYENHSNYIAK